MIFAQVMKAYSVDQIRLLEEKMNAYEHWVFLLILLVAVLILVSVLQRLTIAKLRSFEASKGKYLSKDPTPNSDLSQLNITEVPIADIHTITQTPIHSEMTIGGKDLLDPGLVFKYIVHLDTSKVISIGQREGNIVTRSTDILDHHLTIEICAIDVSNLEMLSYTLELRREGKVLLQLPGARSFREMGNKEKIHISKTLSFDGEPCLESLSPKQPIRFRLGSRINSLGKFNSGYFEFHLYSKDVFEKTDQGTKRIEKHFYLKLVKIFPGYDTAGQTKEGLVPMLARFGG
ncbi:hypothetical protein ND861_17165 [Leptospira sp. 2 VSF19]|uniref:Uncharacterized protein n=1 Tax=Leptospira soteropolitanensis TaxID=2950025 RepID=A0AAW5VLA9_9LEPT|nr:hypothetical protein [Leptospira soteropolitanensis]MCW7494379.1 hypothetical protein [Leptospira soteropolitanensis]MCW7501912.1 hypothetical protein [Leptospira soteropolitanensis]MCW7524225.1 hypothetical protein [Leptospira soteropolitanensis]MCW7528090.1 hypothetical protein [Leptospira soteropolitanensis]MCW7531944.1 hypothetical protein [Leptospira soteropolitanensis]